MELGKRCTLKAGIKDAIHVPIVISKVKGIRFKRPEDESKVKEAYSGYLEERKKLIPEAGDFVKFTDSSLTEVIKASKEEAHGIIDPFLETVDKYGYESVVVILHPSMMNKKVFHTFEVDINGREKEIKELEEILREKQQEDDACGSCYEIVNREVIRH